MKPELKLKSVADFEARPDVVAPALLVNLDPWHRVFLRNLRDLVSPASQPTLPLSSAPGTYWPDVFVTSHLPWKRFAESGVFHIAVVAMLWSSAQWWPRGSQIAVAPAFQKSDVVYYEPADYPLPPLDTGGAKPKIQTKGDPAHAVQPILSVPPEADNHRQTIVTPPNIKLNHDVPLPNIVAMGRPATAIAPAAVVSQVTNSRLPELPNSVVAPAPQITQTAVNRTPNLMQSAVAPAPDVNGVSRRSAQLAQPAIVEPAPSIQTASTRTLSDINIGPSAPVAPAPQLPMGAQHARQGLAESSLQSSGAVAPPAPRVQGGGTSQDGRLIALNLQPVTPNGPVEVPNGNRRGTFAATPEGKPGATGTPDVSGTGKSDNAGRGRAGSGAGAGPSKNNPFALPSGLYVGASSKPGVNSVSNGQGSAGDPVLMASATPPRTTATPRHAAAELPPDLKTDAEKNVFGPRRFYAMTLNVPNLNSQGGSWVMHFAELKDAEKQGSLMAPVATRAVDPGYPLELMRQNVKGTVTLAAVIQSDGSVGDVKILNGIDDRLDEYARTAMLRWKFLPALRDGNPVALQAVVMIPFRPITKKSGF